LALVCINKQVNKKTIHIHLIVNKQHEGQEKLHGYHWCIKSCHTIPFLSIFHTKHIQSQSFLLGIFLKILWLYMYYRSIGRVGYGSKGKIGHIENIFRVSKFRVDHKMGILKYQY
jgi:hypothetical protein